MDKLRALATLSTDDLVEGFQRNPHVASDVWRNLSNVDLGAGNAALYKRWSDTDPESPLHLNALTPKEFEHILAIAREAFALLDAGAPEV